MQKIDLRSGGGTFKKLTRALLVGTSPGALATLPVTRFAQPVNCVKTSGNADLTVNATTGVISSAAGIANTVSEQIIGSITGADGCVQTFDYTLTGVTAPPSFTALPSISAIPPVEVGVVLTFDFGVLINDTVASRRLYKLVGATWTNYADASSGSFTTTEAADYQLWVTGASGIIGKSATTTVAVASGGGLTYDPFLPTPILSLATGVTTYPPQYNFEVPGGVSVGWGIEFRRAANFTNFLAGTYDNAAEPVHVLTAGDVAGGTLTFSGLSAITSPTLTFAYFRVIIGSTYGPWSNIVGHGDATAPSLTSSSTPVLTEGTPLVYTATHDENVIISIGGTDGALLTCPTAGTYSASHAINLVTGNVAFATKNAYSFTITATDPSGNSTTSTIAAAAPAATTAIWGSVVGTDKSQYINRLETSTGNGDYRIASGVDSGAPESMRTNIYRSDTRYWAIKWTSLLTGYGGVLAGVGIAPNASNIGNSAYPTGFVGLDFNSVSPANQKPAVNDEWTLECKAATVGNTDGYLKIWNEVGTLIYNVAHNIVDYRPIISIRKNNTSVLLKTTASQSFAHSYQTGGTPSFD